MKNLAKTFKIVALALALVACAAAGLAFSACGDDLPEGATEYVFEAEYAILPSVGAGWSGGEAGTMPDVDGEFNASNDYFVTNMYAKGSTLTFEIESDSDVSDARIVARLTAEDSAGIMNVNGGKEYSINKDTFQFKVNGVALDYETITFRNIKAANEFRDYTIGKNVSLKKGTNKIELVTNNEDSLGGTTTATAPVVDCIKIATTAKLTMEELTSNLPE